MAEPRSATLLTGAVDPVTLEIIRGGLRAIQSEMEVLIERTAMSPFIREKKDFYAALFDASGRLIVGSNMRNLSMRERSACGSRVFPPNKTISRPARRCRKPALRRTTRARS